MFEIDPDIIKTNILSKFEKDWVKTVAARVLTRKLLTDDGRRTFKDHKSSPWALLRWAKNAFFHNWCPILDLNNRLFVQKCSDLTSKNNGPECKVGIGGFLDIHGDPHGRGGDEPLDGLSLIEHAPVYTVGPQVIHCRNDDSITLKYSVALGTLDSQAGISQGTPNTKRCFCHLIEYPTGMVRHLIGFPMHRLVF